MGTGYASAAVVVAAVGSADSDFEHLRQSFEAVVAAAASFVAVDVVDLMAVHCHW